MNELQEFLLNRPAIKRTELANELEVSSAFIHSVEKGSKKLPSAKVEKLRAFASKYGYTL